MSRSLKGIVLSFLLIGFTTAVFAEQAVGMHADFLSQGLVYRLLSEAGFGFEVMGRAAFSQQNNAPGYYNLSGAVKILKIVNPGRRFRVFLGAGVGAWQVQGEFYDPYADYYADYWYSYTLETKWGMSTAFVMGVDWLIFKAGENWISVVPELQAGYYSRPGGYGGYYYEGPYSFVSPGVGIGLRYVFKAPFSRSEKDRRE
jgi:hypothetical protein